VYIPKLKGPLTIYGYTKDTTSYTSNQVIITAKKALANSANDDATATLRVWTSNFKMCK
jgi:pectinesterase